MTTSFAGTPAAATRPGVRSGWKALRSSPDTVMVPTLVLSTTGVVVHIGLQYLLGVGVAGSLPCPRVYLGRVVTAQCAPGNGRAELTLVLALVVLIAIAQLVVAGIYRAALDLTDGRPVAGPFAVRRPGAVLLTAVLFGVLLTINTLFLVLPAIALAFLTRYTLLFVLDQGLGPVAAAVASTRFVCSDFLAEVRFALAATVTLLVGVLALGVGLYVAVPVVLLAQTQRYRARIPAVS